MIASLDTNVLVYAFDPSDPIKHEIAKHALDRATRQGWPVTAQVYGEFYNATLRRKIATRPLAMQTISVWQTLMPAIPSSLQAHVRALELATKHQIAYWDALIIATCAEHDITTLFTEDAPSVKKPLGVNCKNPFAKK
jgi:predicted nucleic acid-binding protein